MYYNIIGIPKELKNNESRVIFNPLSVNNLVSMGFKVIIQKNAGILSNYTDNEYITNGAMIYETIEEIYENANIIFKVKEPQEYEYNLIKDYHTIVGFFHFAGNTDLRLNMIKSQACCVALESIKDNSDNYPILREMSILAGKNSLNISYNFFNNNIFNKKLVIIGLGNVGNAALTEGLLKNYNNIHLIDINYSKLYNLKLINKFLNIYEYNPENLNKIMKNADIVIGSIYNNVKKTDKIINDEHLNLMNNNSIFIDVCIDQGGMTTRSIKKFLDEPYNIYNNKYIYCVPNIPSLNGKEATDILSNIVYSYFNESLKNVIMNNKNYKDIIINDNIVSSAINIINGNILNNNIL